VKNNDFPLSATDREELIRDVFDNSRAVAWASDWREKRKDPLFANAALESLRDAYYWFIEKLRPEWEAEAKSYSNSRLRDMVQDVIEMGDAVGILHWHEQKQEKEQNKNGHER
jgi:hypothetical protein